MFEIRVICDPPEAERVITALSSVFTTGQVRKLPTRDGKRVRLYATAAHGPAEATAGWPTPKAAYHTAPSIMSELGWISRAAGSAESSTELERDYYLRKAAVLDRMALIEESHDPRPATTDTAEAAALFLLDTDRASLHADVLVHAEDNPRRYVRRAYAAWAQQEQRRALIADGRCPNCQWPQHACNCADHPDA
ncbi:hypothetical protein [Streptomyces sp. MNP-20]|uniref:hypothetical protein n=1 Tax=Streptomyces sp. MNP-20 TaxID=2721165 RepID=UPI001555C1C0|nr:hypothetical protein [Streptomyces sp. MNP-20]